MTKLAFAFIIADSIEPLLVAISFFAAALTVLAYMSTIWRERFRTVKYSPAWRAVRILPHNLPGQL